MADRRRLLIGSAVLAAIGVVLGVLGLLAAGSAQDDQDQARQRVEDEQQALDDQRGATADAEAQLIEGRDSLDALPAAAETAVATGAQQQAGIDDLVPDLDRQVQISRDERAAAIAGNFGEYNRLLDEEDTLTGQVNAKAAALRESAATLFTQLEELVRLAEVLG